MPADTARRPLKSRSTAWARALAGALVRARVHPDAISVASLGFAAAGAALLARWPTSVGLVAAAACVQLRLLCNLLDGMVAIEGGRKSAVGALYNEVPDRLADSAFLVGLGMSIGEAWLGWLAALAAAMTAYVRVLGGSFGLAQDFRGPMAKPHRMAVLTAGCLAGSVERSMGGGDLALTCAAWIVAAGALLTCVTRTLAIARALRAASRGDA